MGKEGSTAGGSTDTHVHAIEHEQLDPMSAYVQSAYVCALAPLSSRHHHVDLPPQPTVGGCSSYCRESAARTIGSANKQ